MIYANNANQSDYISEMNEYITHENRNEKESSHTAILNNWFDLVELNKHRNEDFPLVVHNFDEIEVAPLFMFVVH